MNKWWIWILALLLCAFRPKHTVHDTTEKVDEEIKEIELTVQPKQFRVFPGTPTLADLEDHEIVIVSTNGINSLMWRDNIDIFSVRGSCVTVIR